jgi:hypothetical protein
MGLIREAPGPVTVRNLATAVAQSHGLDMPTPQAMRTLIAKTRTPRTPIPLFMSLRRRGLQIHDQAAGQRGRARAHRVTAQASW